MRKSEAEKLEAIQRLKTWVKAGDTLHTIIRHVSKSGMSRRVSVVKIENDGSVAHLDFTAAKALGRRCVDNGDGVVMQGCGMDMGFELVYSIGRAIYPNGFECIGEKCRSNDHANGDRDRTPHHHSDGGYAINQRWL